MSDGRIRFGDALERTSGTRRNLLLGNGFSMGADDGFGYPALYARAVQSQPKLADLFPPGSVDFEVAMEGATSSTLVRRLQIALIMAVANAHPDSGLHLSPGHKSSCLNFLRHFLASDLPGRAFSTNYDLLLHWVISSQGKRPGTKQHRELETWDGFSSDGYWDQRSGADAHIFYLHGAVHIFERPFNEARLKFYAEMLRWYEKNPLPLQVRGRLVAGDYPVFVAEGSSEAKVRAQSGSAYLKFARGKFRKTCNEATSVLFTYGLRFGPSDQHISDAIALGRVKEVYFGAYSASGVERAAELEAYWNSRRSEGQGVSVIPYDTTTAGVWPD